jgi:S1-C subfamily serine protease
VITSVAGRPVRNVSELLTAVAALKPGEPARLGLSRSNGPIDMTITPGIRPTPKVAR